MTGKQPHASVLARLALITVVLASMTACSDIADSGNGYGARDACREWVKGQLKAPSTADFTDESGYEEDTGPWTILGAVDAENSFGAKIRTSWTCDVRLDSDDYYRGNATLLE